MLDQQRGGEADCEIDQAGEDQKLMGLTDDVAARARGVEEVHQPHGVNQRGVLEQDDALLQQQRGHLAKRLGQDDQAHGLRIAHPQCLRRAHLAARDGLDAGANDLAEVRRLEHDERHQAGAERADRGVLAGDPAQHERHREVEPGDHQQQRDRAEVVDIGGGGFCQQTAMGQTHQRQQSAQHHTTEHAHDHQLQGHQHAVPETGQRRQDRTEVHYLPPTAISPGTATRFSTARISSIRPMFKVK